MSGVRKWSTVQVKRVYDPPSKDDGVRVLVDRLWPRGLSKARASVDLWLKDIAPSVALRRWFNHDPTRWGEFVRRYAEELDKKHASVAALAGAVRRGRVTLLFGARDARHNNAVALHAYLTKTLG
jgi:uncharacterized protein YeaO (DUF488 family)